MQEKFESNLDRRTRLSNRIDDEKSMRRVPFIASFIDYIPLLHHYH